MDLEFDRANGELQIMEQRLEISEKKLFGGGMSSKETENRRCWRWNLCECGLSSRSLMLWI